MNRKSGTSKDAADKLVKNSAVSRGNFRSQTNLRRGFLPLFRKDAIIAGSPAILGKARIPSSISSNGTSKTLRVSFRPIP